ncbi:MAG: hypothetical protein R2818_15810 [Flavobacteriales bacterium]
MEDEVGIRAKGKMFWTPCPYNNTRYQSYTFDINENTLQYTDKQLAEVTTIPDKHEDELQEYKETKDILKPSTARELVLQ